MKNQLKFFLPSLFFLSILVSPLFLNAQAVLDLEWANQIGGTFDDIGTTVGVDASGNVYVTGEFLGTMDFDPGSGVFNLTSTPGQFDAFIIKLDANGGFLWAKQIKGSGYKRINAIHVDPSNNIYISGRFSYTADFDPGTAILDFTSMGSRDIFICKLNSSGGLIWAKQIGGSNFETNNSLAMDASGNIYTVGSFGNANVDFDPGTGVFNLNSGAGVDMYVLKLDSFGNFKWAKQFGELGYGDCFSVVVDDISGNIYITGFFMFTVDFDPGTGVQNLTSNGKDIFICKLSTSGNFVWAKKMGGNDDDEGTSISIDNTGNIYTSGYFEGNADFDPSSASSLLNSSGGTDVFVSKLDASGNFLWAKGFGANGTDFATSSVLDSSGNIHITGLFEDTVDFDPGSGTSNLTSAGNSDFFVSKLDPSGNFLWAEGFGGSGSDAANSIALDNPGNILVTGVFENTVDFDPGSGTSNLVSAGLGDVFVLKLKENLDIEENSFSNISLYPNPVTNRFYIVGPGMSQPKKVVLYDILGNRVKTFPPNTQAYDVSNLQNGLYFVEIENRGKSLVRKILKE